MEKREKIILLLMLVALGYGAYLYLFSDEEVTSVKDIVNMDELNRVKNEVDKKLNEHPLTDLERYRLKMAERAFIKDPFYDRTKDVVAEDEAAIDTQLPPDVVLRYTGYISIRGELYAIVNDMEYQEGEELDIAVPGFYVFEISENKIVIGKKDENDEIVGQQEVFLEEVTM